MKQLRYRSATASLAIACAFVCTGRSLAKDPQDAAIFALSGRGMVYPSASGTPDIRDKRPFQDRIAGSLRSDHVWLSPVVGDATRLPDGRPLQERIAASLQR